MNENWEIYVPLQWKDRKGSNKLQQNFGMHGD